MSILIPDTEIESPVELVGGKAEGILKLKSLKEKLDKCYGVKPVIPAFFVVPTGISLTQDYREIVRQAEQLKTRSFAVRSSSALEDRWEHSFDGIFDTELGVSLDRLVRAIHRVRKSAVSERAQAYSKEIGVELDGKMPVIVQAMVENPSFIGVVYSKFPSPTDMVKVIRERGKHRHIDAFKRKYGDYGVFSSSILVASELYPRYGRDESKSLADLVCLIENEFGYPIILEFAYSTTEVILSNEGRKINLLQARKLTKLSEAEKFKIPELQEKGLVASTSDINGVGDVTKEAYVINHPDVENGSNVDYEELDRLNKFDKEHPEGYVLVAPYIQFYNTFLDEITPHKKAVVAYSALGIHHDMEIARKRGLLYVNAQKNNISRGYFPNDDKESRRKRVIETGEKVRVVSNGEQGFVFNLSRE